MTCEQVINQLDALIDGELGPIANWRVRRHLGGCSSCTRAWEEKTRLSRSLQQWRDARPAPELQARIAAALAAEQIPPLLKQPPRPHLNPAWLLAAALLLGALVWAAWRQQHPASLEYPRALPSELRTTLEALARMRSAHASGRYWIRFATRNRHARPNGASTAYITAEHKVDYWYEAPDRYYQKMAPMSGPNRGRPTYLLLEGGRGWLMGSDGLTLPLDAKRARERMTVFSLFGGAATPLAAAAGQSGAQTVLAPGAPGGRRVQILTKQGHTWRVDIDGESRRILGLEYQTPTKRIELDSFEYEGPLPSELERLKAP